MKLHIHQSPCLLYHLKMSMGFPASLQQIQTEVSGCVSSIGSHWEGGTMAYKKGQIAESNCE